MMSTQTQLVHFRLLHFNWPPYVNPCAYHSQLKVTYGCRYPGWSSEMIDVILRQANISYELLRIKDSRFFSGYGDSYASITSGETQLLSMMEDLGQADYYNVTGVGPLTGANDYLAVLARKTVENSAAGFIGEYFSFLLVFDTNTWLSLLVILLINQFYVRLAIKCGNASGNVERETQSRRLSKNATIAIVSLILAIIGTLYRNGLLARLLVEHQRPLFTDYFSFLGAVQSGQIHVVYLEDYFPDNEEFNKVLEENKALELKMTFTNSRLATKMVQDDSNIVFIEYQSVLELLAQHLCDAYIVELPELGHSDGGLFASPYLSKSIINRLEKSITDNSAMFTAIKQKYRRYASRKSAKCAAGDETKRILKIEDIKGILMLFGALSVLAVIFVGFEIVSMLH